MERVLLDILSARCYNLDIALLKDILMNLTINGLTYEQVEMLDMMWSLDTEEDFLEWYGSLSSKDMHQCDLLQRLILMESFDTVMEQENDYSDAKRVLSKYRLN